MLLMKQSKRGILYVIEKVAKNKRVAEEVDMNMVEGKSYREGYGSSAKEGMDVG